MNCFSSSALLNLQDSPFPGNNYSLVPSERKKNPFWTKFSWLMLKSIIVEDKLLSL